MYFIYGIFIFFFYKSNQNGKCEKIISSSFRRTWGDLTINVTLGTPPQTVNLHMDLINDITYMNKSIFIKDKSQTFITQKDELLQLNNKTIPSCLSTDKFRILSETVEIEEFYFYYIESIVNPPYDGAIGLSPHSYLSNLSFISQLYDNNLISNKSFGIHFIREYNGNIFFGGIPYDILKDYPFSFSCQQNLNESLWGCILKKVYLNNNKEYEYGKIAYFNLNDTSGLVPLSFIHYLNETFFNPFYPQRRCIYYEYKNYVYIWCRCEVINIFPNITFAFENEIEITLNGKDIFVQSEGDCYLLMKSRTENNNEWCFGYFFMLKNMLLFNYENNEMRIYSKNILKKQKGNKVKLFLLKILVYFIGGYTLLLANVVNFLNK